MNDNIRKENQTLRVGILGCGTICQAAHFEACVKSRNIELVAICDVAEDLLVKMATRYDVAQTYTVYEEMLKNESIDAIIIGIGDQYHAICARQALEAGKHVFVEKPLGVSIEECEALEQLIGEKALTFQVGNMKRFDPGLQFARDFVKKEIGEITTFKGWYCDSTGRYQVCDNVMPILYSSEKMKKPEGNPKENKDIYYLLGHASHLFDTARYFMGDIVSVEVKYVVKQGLYSWLIACDFADGAIGNLDLSIAVRMDWHEGLEIYGTNGSVLAKTYNPWVLRVSDVECCNETTKVISKPYDVDGHFFRRQLEGFADVVLKGSQQEGANIRDGLQTLRAIIATHESVLKGGRRIYLRDVKGSI